MGLLGDCDRDPSPDDCGGGVKWQLIFFVLGIPFVLIFVPVGILVAFAILRRPTNHKDE